MARNFRELIDKVLVRFIKFCDEYMSPYGNLKNLEAYRLKRDHTLRVYDIACKLVELQNVDEETKMIVLISAILHDVGRFEQWRITHSYSDVNEPKHPEIGAKMLENGYIKKFIPETRKYDSIIILAVREHGSLELPKEMMNEQEYLVCQLVRDSDRIDILYQCTIESDFQILYSQECGERKLSVAVKKSFAEGKSVRFADIKSKFDMLGLRLALCKQMSTKSSERYILEKDFPNQMVRFFKKQLTDKEGHFYYDENELQWLRSETMKYLKSKIE